MRASLKVEGLAELTGQWSVVQRQARKLEEPLRSGATRRDLQRASERRFNRGLRKSSREWTIEKAQRGLDTRTMRATGTAEAALTRNAGPGRSAVVFSAFNGVLTWGVRRGRSSLYYLQVQAGRKPARRVVVIDKTARQAITRRVLAHVTEPFE